MMSSLLVLGCMWGDEAKATESQLNFQIISPFFQIGSSVGLRYHDFFKVVPRFLQIILSLLTHKVIHTI